MRADNADSEDRDVLTLFVQTQPLFTALGDERRQTIVIILLKAGTALSVGEIVSRMGLSQPAVSYHLKILREAGLLRVKRHHAQRFYSLNTGANAALLTPMKELAEALTTYR